MIRKPCAWLPFFAFANHSAFLFERKKIFAIATFWGFPWDVQIHTWNNHRSGQYSWTTPWRFVLWWQGSPLTSVNDGKTREVPNQWKHDMTATEKQEIWKKYMEIKKDKFRSTEVSILWQVLVVCTLLVTVYQLTRTKNPGAPACLCCVALTTLDVTPTLFYLRSLNCFHSGIAGIASF